MQNRIFNSGVSSALEGSRASESVVPFALTPFVSPFKKRGGPSFPMPDQFNQYRTPINPENNMDVQPLQSDNNSDDSDFYSPGYNPTTGKKNPMPNVTAIEGKGMSSYIPVEKEEGLTGWKGLIQSAVKKELAFPERFNPITATDRTYDVSGALKNAMGPIGPLTALGSELNRRNLSDIATRAALGEKGYSVGMFENQVVGQRPGTPVVQGVAPSNSVLQKRIQQQLSNLPSSKKGGALGSAYTNYQSTGGRFDMSKPLSAEQEAYENTVMNLKISTSQKAALLGYNPNTKNPLDVSNRAKADNYYTITPFEQVLEDRRTTSNNRSGDVENGSFTDVSAPSLGLETDIYAQQSQVNPMGINLGINMDNISGVPTGVNITPSPQLPTFAPDPFYNDSDDGNNNDSGADSSSMGDSGFGGGGGYSTAYGGRIKKAYGGGSSKGFVSSKPTKITIQGVGLIEPEETFLKTDMVRDRYELTARENDFIINGPTSSKFKAPIRAFIKQAETNLKNKGVDISVGKPTIPVSKQIPLLVASSENYIPKEYIEAFNLNDPEEGYKILEAMNNVGKPEVANLKKQLDQPTGNSKYLQAAEGTEVTDEEYLEQLRVKDKLPKNSPYPKDMIKSEEFSKEDLKALKNYYTRAKIKKPQRGDVLKLIDSLSDTGAIGLTVLTESYASRDSDDSLRNIANVILNRVEDKKFDFRKKNTIKDVLKHQTKRGAKEGKLGMFHFDGLEPSSIRNRLNEIFEKGQKQVLNRVLTAATNAQSKEPDFIKRLLSKDILFYDKPNSPASIGSKYVVGKNTKDNPIAYVDNPLVDVAYEVDSKDGHTFYRMLQTPDVPMGETLNKYNKTVYPYQKDLIKPKEMSKRQHMKYLREKSKMYKDSSATQ